MLKVGITGGIGSGKSYICNIFNKHYNIPIYNSDDRAKIISNTNSNVISTLKKWYGKDIYIKGKLNRKKLSNIIFNDKNELQKINNLFYPFLKKDFLDWTKEHKVNPYVILECAVLFENGFNEFVDITINVYSVLSTRLLRIIKRDNTIPDKAMERIKNQLPDEELNKLTDITISNENYDDIYEQIKKIDYKLLTLNEITHML